MAAAGGGGAGPGGKIRSRRYHLSSGRAPYSKNRLQGQQGIISRVTDTVKSIVPGWLQNYFNKNETSDGVQKTSVSVVENAGNKNSDIHHHIYIDDDGSPATNDGRITPEPVINLADEEPSTSRSSLNLPEVLTRPCLHRANLNFNILDSPALNCQPSTSSAFPIGSSGFSLVKEIKDSTSQHDDDNISTTSGFSSRASDKDVTISRNANAPPLWTPEADRSQPLSHNSSMSSKKPMFNLSTFGTLSPSLGNTSVLKSSQLGDSPFYPGKTTYGGAAARPSRVRATPYQAPVRRQVKAKPANVQSYGVTSATARRILQSLEKMSSPLADAKRIPSVSSSPLSFTPEKSFSDVEENPSKRKKVDSAYPPVKKLMTPKSIAISTNRSFYIKPSLTPSAVANTTSRRIQTEKHREPRRNHDPDQPLVPQSESNFSYPKFSTPASNGLSPGGGGKMMRGRGSHYTTKLADEETEVPTLPEVPLPLSTAALPSFNFSTLSSTTTTSLPVTVSKPADSKVQTDVVNKNPMFTFSSPIVKSTESNAQSPGSSVGFTFSVPSVKSSSPPITVNNTMFAIGSPAKTTIALNNGSAKKEEEKGGFCKPAKELKEGSVMDILRGPGFSSPSSSQTASPTVSKSTAPLTKPTVSTFSIGKVAFGEGNKQALGLWQCNTCLVENKASDGKCVACSALKEQPAGALKSQTTSTLLSNTKNSDVTSTQGFGDIFKVAPGTWECETCLVQNKPEVIKCVACETPKPGAGVKPALLLTPSTQAVKAITTSDKTLANAPCSLFEAFKKPEGSWECSVCCVQNKEQDSKCVACTSEKPGSSSSVKTATLVSFTPTCSNQLGLTDVFKRPEGSWDCDVCLIQNKPEATKCVACENNKPGTKAELKGFGTSSLSTGSSAPSFKFGLQPSSSTDELKSGVSTDSTPSKTSLESGFNFPSSGGKFTFGISSTKPAEETKKIFSADISTSNSSSTGFKFGTTTPPQPESGSKSLSSSFSFGKVSNTSSAPVADSSSGSGFQFQVAKELSTPTISFNPKESEEKTSESALGGFTFGKVEHNKETSSTFVFGKKDEKTDSTNTGQVIFGVKREMEEPKQFSFSKSEQTKDNTATPTFAFGVPNPTEKKNSDNTTKPGFCFAPQTTTADTEASKQTFGLIGSGSSATQSGASASSSNAFGSTVPTGASASTSSLFGIAAQSSTPSGSSGLFGSTTQSTTSVSTSGVFGSIVPTSAPVSTSSVFGITAQSSTSAGSSGLFGSVVQSSASAGSGSVFGTAASSSTPAGSSSVFGNSASSITPAGSSSVFGNAASSSTPAGSTSVFGSGAPSNAPAGSSSVFGSAATSTTPANSNSVFGSATPITTSSSSIFGAAPTSTSANSSSIFGNSTTTSNTLAGTFMFGQPSSTAGGSVFGSTTESKSSFVFSGQESKPATTSTSTPVASPFQFGANPGATNPVQGFNFGGANASNVSGSASTPSPFVFGASSSAPAPSALAVSANTVPAFGQSASQTNVPAFGSSSTLFPSGSQNVPAFGSVSSTSQPPAFGQQATQPSFGSSPAPAPGSGFQFGGNTNFNFASGASSGVFTFGSSSAGASTQPAQSGFMFNQTPTFNLGTNGRNAAPPPPSIATRKIKTARRRK